MIRGLFVKIKNNLQCFQVGVCGLQTKWCMYVFGKPKLNISYIKEQVIQFKLNCFRNVIYCNKMIKIVLIFWAASMQQIQTIINNCAAADKVAE